MIINKGFTETHDFLLSVIGGAPYGIIVIDLSGNITIANSQAVDHLGLGQNVNDLVEMEITEVIDDLEDLKLAIEKCLVHGRENFDLVEVHHQDKYLSFRGRKILNGMIITIADITSIKESEHATLNSLMEGQEIERKRIAQEIHDGIGPILSTVKMNLSSIEQGVKDVDQSLAEKFRKSYDMIDEAANDLRSISHNLMPKVLSDFGLAEALETLCEKVEETKKLDVQWINNGLEERLDKVTELSLYRICQELINNTIKYADASRISIQLVKRDQSIHLIYEDDGNGFSPNVQSSGIGLTNIDNRARALAGEAIIDSQPGKGMTALIDIPL